MPLKTLLAEIAELADPVQAKNLQRFFKTGKGQYGEGDIFLGLKVPVIRGLVKRHPDISGTDVLTLLKSKYHEHRLMALLFLVRRYLRATEEREKEDLFSNYLAHTEYINNWDLVDLSAPYIVGMHLYERPRKILYQLAKSSSLWERRIAVVSTFYFIRQGESKDIFAIADLLLNDQHDLIQKAVGWMLREAGKRISEAEEKCFLEPRYRKMPRTMLRYAIERFSVEDRKHFMAK